MTNYMVSIGSAVGLMVLILDAKTAFIGANEGILLCIHTIIPSLFPFFMLSILFTNGLAGRKIPFLAPIVKLCKMPAGSESILAVGLLGGYPVGAQAVAQAYEQKQLSKHDASRLLGFCSNAGPAFIFGMIRSQFNGGITSWLLWGIHILSALLVGFWLPGGSEDSMQLPHPKAISVSDALKKALSVTATVCGWVILFRMLICFLSRWFLWMFPQQVQTALYGIFELANGCMELHQIKNVGLRFILCSGMLSFGGLCVAMQTASVTQKIGLGMYFPGKLLQCVISVFIASFMQTLLFPVSQRYSVPIWLYGLLLAILLLAHYFLCKNKKSCSNLTPIGI